MGAIALVVFVVIFLPIILDREQKPIRQDLTVQIPSQDAGRFNTRVLPPPAARLDDKSGLEKSPVLPKPLAEPEEPKTATSGGKPAIAATPGTLEGDSSKSAAAAAKERSPSQEKDRSATTEKEPARLAEKERAQAALTDQVWMVPLGAFSNPENVKRLQARLGAAGIKAYAEPVATRQGEQIRVRAGPYPSREAAEQAREKLKGMSLPDVDVGAVVSR